MDKVVWVLFYPVAWILSRVIPIADQIRMKREVPATLRSAGPSAEYGEEAPPLAEMQRRYNKALSDRLDAQVKQDMDLQAKRRAWAEEQEWEEQVYEEIEEMTLPFDPEEV
jgi:hypothetical protein